MNPSRLVLQHWSVTPWTVCVTCWEPPTLISLLKAKLLCCYVTSMMVLLVIILLDGWINASSLIASLRDCPLLDDARLRFSKSSTAAVKTDYPR